MLSRVADYIYWIGRYVERAENYARIIDVNKNLILDMPENPDSEQWGPMIYTTGDSDKYISKYNDHEKNSVIKFMAVDLDNQNSIFSCISKARENAIAVQNEINSEMWIVINDFYHFLKNRVNKRKWDDDYLNEFLSGIINFSHLFIGTMDSTFSHTESWLFAYMGRMLERADKTARILDTKYYYLLSPENSVGLSIDIIQWQALLNSASGFETYRKKFTRLNIPNIIKFLVLDDQFPRAVNYCIARTEKSLHRITDNHSIPYSCESEKLIGRLRSELEFIDEDEILSGGLHDFLVKVENRISTIGEAINKQFFI